MGDKTLEPETNEPEKESYRIIIYPAIKLPEEFRNLIIGPFLNSLRYGNDMFKLIDKESYYNNYGRYVELLLQRPTAMVKLAQLDDETVLGWSLIEDQTLHYVWIKKEVRRQGIAKALMPKEFNTISHITNKGMNIWVNKFPLVRFNPFA